MSEPVELIVCSTCGSAERDAEGRTRGEQLLARVQDAARAALGIRASSVRCLWACAQRCTVHVRARGRFGYVLGQFEPSDEAAQALVDYAKLYAETADGAVPFKRWPTALRGHFVCRIPVPNDDLPSSTSAAADPETTA